MNLTQLLLRRFSRLILTVFFAATAIFFIIRVIPGDPAGIIAGIEASSNPEILEEIRSSLGLNKAIHIQYLQWIGSIMSLDFGSSFLSGEPVAALIIDRLGLTISLAGLGMLVSLFISLPVGIVSAINESKPLDNILMGVSHFLLALPEFWLGILLLLLFSVYIPLFPLFGSSSFAHFVLPGLALGIGRAAFLSRLVRTSVLRELEKEYVVFFSQLGVPRRRIILRHVLPNAVIPIAVPASIQFGYLLGGAIIIEQVFGMGGIGRLMLHSIQTRDFPVIQGVIILMAIIFSTVNFAADVFVVLADPRARI